MNDVNSCRCLLKAGLLDYIFIKVFTLKWAYIYIFI